MATPQYNLTEAQTAYHKLMTGQAVVSFEDQNGEKVTYTQANSGKLAQYIRDLQRQIDSTNPTNGPMRVWF